MSKQVKTKQDFVKRFQEGEFGNKLNTWNTVEDWLKDPNGHGTTGRNSRKFHLRNRVAGGVTYYDLTVNQLIQTIGEINPKDFYVSEMAPHDLGTIQGEVHQTVNGLYLRYTRELLPMRDALASSQEHCWRMEALCLLRHSMCFKSYEWLEYLLETYVDHVVEFSCFSCPVGTMGWNTLFWEVRMY